MKTIQTKNLFTRASKWAALSILMVCAALLVQPQTAFAAGETYSYASSGTKISGKGGKLGSSTVVFTKNPTGTYGGSTTISDGGTTCVIGLQITAQSGAKTGTISAPAHLNGGTSIGGGTKQCSASFAAGVADLNRGITISGSISIPDPPDGVAETPAQRAVLVTVFSEKPPGDSPSTTVTLAKSSTPGDTQTRTVNWGTTSVDSVTFSDKSPGSYIVCVLPKGAFTFQPCKTVTKVAKQVLQVDFGSEKTAYNKDGKVVNVTVRVSIPGHIGQKTYGPTSLSIMNAGNNSVIKTGDTNSNTVGADASSSVPAQDISLSADFDNIEPGRYRVCINSTDVCSSDFTKVANVAGAVDIKVGVDDSDKLVTGSGDGKETCNVSGVGWIVCPVAKFLGSITDGAYALVEKLLVFQVGNDPLDTNDPNNAIYQIWNNVRNLANIAFIFAFFTIILSQATTLGVTNYGIKKMLPRLVVAAIFVNLSYYISVFAIDISNIIGAGIDGIIQAPLAGLPPPADGSGSWNEMIVLLLAGAAVTGAAITGALALALPLVGVALMAILTALVILIARHAILILLIVIAPLAFVAYILPNTEDLFNKWRKLFMTMLVFYPLVAIIFSGSKVASRVIRDAGIPGVVDNLLNIFSLAILALPLFALPFLLKISGGVLGKIGGLVNNPAKGPIDRMRKKGQEMYQGSSYQSARSARVAETQNRKKKAFYRAMAGNGSNRKRRLGQLGVTGMGTQGITPGGREDIPNVRQNLSDQYRKIQTDETNRALASVIESGGFSPGSTYRVLDKNGMAKQFEAKNSDGSTRRDASGNIVMVDYTADPRAMVNSSLADEDSMVKIENAAGITKDFASKTIDSALLSQTAKMGDIPLTEAIIKAGGPNAAAMKEFISYNPGNYATKAPDYIKGEVAAFNKPKASEVVGWHYATAKRAQEFAETKPESATNIAISIQQALNNPELRSNLDRIALDKLIKATVDSTGKTTGGTSAIWSKLDAADQVNLVQFMRTGK